MNGTNSLVRLSILLAMLCVQLCQQCLAASRLPDSEPAWKNVLATGRSTAVFSLYIDSRGIMWVGTNNGLLFYDGVVAHQVMEKRLAGVQVYAMVEHDGYLYLGTNNGLLKFCYSSGDIYEVENCSFKEIRCLYPVDGELWIGSLYGMYVLEPAASRVRDVSAGLPHKSVYSVMRDSRGILYAGTYNGLARWDASKKRFSEVNCPVENHEPKNRFVNCLLESYDGRCIYVGGEGSLYRYVIANEKWEKIPQVEGNNIKSLAGIYDNHILVGTDDGVFDLYEDGSVKHYRHDSRLVHTLSNNEIWCIMADKDNNVCVGHERGFSIASHSNSIRIVGLGTLSNSGEGNELRTILRDNAGDLWLGGTNGILRLPGDGGPTRWYRHSDRPHSLSHNRIRAVDEDADGRIWLSTDGGLNRYNRGADNFDVFHVVDSAGNHNTNWVYAIEEDAGSYWIGAFLGGLHRVPKSRFSQLNGGTVTSEFVINADTKAASPAGVGLENDLVNNIVRDSKGNLWILLFRDDKLTCYDPVAGTVKLYDIHEISGGGYPSGISLDNSDRVWCAFNGGAVVFDEHRDCLTIRFATADEPEPVLAMGPVDNDMWVSTTGNMWKIDGKSGQPTLLPIPQKAYTAVYQDLSTGKVLLGATDEIVEVDPEILLNSAELKTVKIAMIEHSEDGRAYNLFNVDTRSDRLVIPYGGSVSLVVSSLDYSPETLHRYMYKLAESKNDTVGEWIVLPEGVNTITMTDLMMGDYEILVKQVGMPAPPVSIAFNVERPRALSWWALCGYVVLFLGLIYGVVLYIHRRNRMLFQEKERRKSIENVEKKLAFLSNISHDLKTPLSMIIGPVSLLKERVKDSESRRNLETIYDNAVRLNNMIHRTIELHDLEDDDENLLIMSIFDVVEFCKDAFEIFKENNPQKKFVFHSSCSGLFVEGDAVKFESVITNLLSNACKYSEDGATISCGINRRGESVEIVVSDDGLGISERDQPLVFQRMFRASSTAKLREGTGLGLYLIKKYLDMMNGTIDLYSKQGQGTSFIVTMPLSDKEIPLRNDEPVDDAGDRQKILLVEDNPQISAFISDFLKHDYTILTAENGRAGLAIASSFQPDLIIADEMMPILSGLEMCRRMKQNPRLAMIPMIMLTAKSDNQTENESIKLGIDVFMSKPFDPNVLLGRIRHLLKSRNEIKETVRIQAITEAKPIEAESATEKQLAKIARIIEDNISDPDLNVNFLCEKSEIPNKQLYRIIKKYIGVGPLDYIRRVRLQKAAMLLSQRRFTVSEISYMVGFKTPSYFAKCFQAQFGVKPSQYQSDDESVGKSSDR